VTTEIHGKGSHVYRRMYLIVVVVLYNSQHWKFPSLAVGEETKHKIKFIYFII